VSGIPLGPARGRLLLHTTRDGLASAAGHDLVIEATRWSGDLRPAGAGLADSTVDVTVDLASLVVVSGRGGALPLTDRDRAEIAATMRTLLGTGSAEFRSTRVVPDAGAIEGSLSLNGVTRPSTLRVVPVSTDRYRGTTTVIQSEYGIKPYSAFFGALRVGDAVTVEFTLDLTSGA
jgi:polyisoprenoid-binding protein YceI